MLVLFISSYTFFLLCGTVLASCSEDFSWLPNAEGNIVGYKIYYAQTNGGPYPNFVYISNLTPVEGKIQGSVTELNCGQQYYFICVAVNNVGVEGAYSSQATVTAGAGIPGMPNDLIIIEPN